MAVLVFAYFVNAFIQSWLILPWELVVGALWLALCYVLSVRSGVATILVFSFAIAVGWGLFIESTPVSDFRNFHVQAERISDGRLGFLFVSKSPTMVSYYAVFHLLLGSSYATNYIASAVAWTAGAGIFYHAAKALIEEGKARFICAGLALCPTFLVFAPVVSSESVFYLLTALWAWLMSRHLTGKRLLPHLYIAIGLVAALLFFTRGNGLLILLVTVLALFATSPTNLLGNLSLAELGRRICSRIPWVASSLVVASFALIVVAHAGLSWASGHGAQFSGSHWAPLQLLFGTNREHRGGFNVADAHLSGYTGDNRLPRAEAARKAGEIAIERIREDVPGFARFAFTAKMGRLWGRENSLYNWAVGDKERRELLRAHIQTTVLGILDGAYRLVFLLFLVWLITQVRRPSYFLVLALIAFLYALPHLLVEVQPRYHVTMTPYLLFGGLLFAHQWTERGAMFLASRGFGWPSGG